MQNARNARRLAHWCKSLRISVSFKSVQNETSQFVASKVSSRFAFEKIIKKRYHVCIKVVFLKFEPSPDRSSLGV